MKWMVVEGKRDLLLILLFIKDNTSAQRTASDLGSLCFDNSLLLLKFDDLREDNSPNTRM